VSTTLATYPHVPSEPPLACYVTASCSPQGGVAPATASSPAPKKHKKHKRHKKRRR
jgi:hypothetical protein